MDRDIEFRWNPWNLDHASEHGVSRHACEEIVRNAKRPYPEEVGDGKFMVRGQASDGSYLQVIFIVSPPPLVYVIHARPLSEAEKRRYRRRSR